MKAADVKGDGVVVSKRLTDSPVVVVMSKIRHSGQQEQIIEAQTFRTVWDDDWQEDFGDHSGGHSVLVCTS